MGKVLISTGGTGGHIFPAVAVGKTISTIMGQDVLYFLGGSKLGIVKSLEDKKVKSLKLDSPFTGNILKRIKNGFKIVIYTIYAVFFLLRHSVNKIIATGSYASFPVLMAASLCRKKFYLLEQNSIPGQVIRFFSPRSRMVFTSFPKSQEYLKGKILMTGNPIRDEAKIQVSKSEAMGVLGIDTRRPVVLLWGGSLGAATLVRIALEFAQKNNEYFFIVQAGRNISSVNVSSYKTERYFIFDFNDSPGIVYSAADFCISRAGAGSIYEIAYHGIPSVFVPYPFAKDNHQFYNAKYVEENKAGIVIEEKNLNVSELDKALTALKTNRYEIERRLHSLFPHDADIKIAKEIIKDGNEEKV